MVSALCADVHDFTIAADLVPSDDTIGVLWWSPADLHWLWTSDLYRKNINKGNMEKM